jgi:hypothetical protein
MKEVKNTEGYTKVILNIGGKVAKLKVLSCYETVSFLVNESLLLDAGGVTTMLNIEEQEEANNLSNLKAIFIETTLPNRLPGFACTSGHLVPMSLEEELKNWKGSSGGLNGVTIGYIDEVYFGHITPHYKFSLEAEHPLPDWDSHR